MLHRRDFLRMATLGAAGLALSLRELELWATNLRTSARMPAVFIGHGSPMNALQDNPFTQALTTIGQQLPVPQAAMVVSAHWETRGTFVGTHPQPPTIHDFGGFPQALFQQQYPAKGAPDVAQAVIAEAAVNHFQLHADGRMGLDHGAWTVLKFLWPHANVPVFQLSLDYALTPGQHLALAQALRSLRDKGVLLVGSGNLVHNLSTANFPNRDAAPVDWAAAFDATVKERLLAQDYAALANPAQWGAAFRQAHPSTEHYLPALYTTGFAHPGEPVQMLFEGFHHGTISMRCFAVGG